MMTTSIFSPRCSRAGTASGVLPMLGPQPTLSRSPLRRSYAGARVLYAAANPPELTTRNARALDAPGVGSPTVGLSA